MAECGFLNFATCLPQLIFEYIANILNAPLQPLLDMTKNLLSAQVNIQVFSSLWAIIIYVLSMFYAFLIIYSGFQFIISGYDSAKRENAKEWLKNIVIMIILVQASFFIYELLIQISASVTASTLTLVNNNFFLLTIDNGLNLTLEIVFFTIYIIVLLLTSLMLIVRYGVVAVGVVLFPLGIFCYFIQPLRAYGLLLLNFLGVALCITFLDAILLIVFAQLVTIPLFANIKILVMISAFGLMNIMMFFLMFFSIIKSAVNVGMKVGSFIAKVAA